MNRFCTKIHIYLIKSIEKCGELYFFLKLAVNLQTKGVLIWFQ